MSFFGLPRGRNKALNTVRIVLLNGNTTNNATIYYDTGNSNGQSGGTGTVVTYYPGTWLPIYATGGAGSATVTASAVNNLEIFDSYGFTSRVGTGAPASQADLFLDYPGGNGFVPVQIVAGTQLWVQPITIPVFVAGATPPEMTISFFD